MTTSHERCPFANQFSGIVRSWTIGEPGTARTSPCSPADRAVVKEPDRSAASNDDHGAGETGNDSIAAWKVSALRLGPRRHFGDDHSVVGYVLIECAVFAGIDIVDAAGQSRHCPTFKCANMRCGIDAARHAGDDDKAGRRKLHCEYCGKRSAVRRRIARPDDRDGRTT